MPNTYPPGPRTGWFGLLRVVATGQKFDPLAYAKWVSDTYGGLVYTRFGPVRFYMVADADLTHDILVTQNDKFHKAKTVKEVFRPFIGNGLLLSEGDFWKRQRKLTQPAFHSKRIQSYADTMVAHTERMLDTWRDSQPVWIDRAMMKLTLNIVCKTLFDADVSGDADRVGDLMTETLEAASDRLNAAIRLPEWLPTPKRRRQKAMIAELDAIIQRFISERRATREDKGDLLSMLLLAQDEDGSQMTDQQLRDEVMTLFIAGHETTAVALSWTWYLLSQNPDKLATLLDEVDSVLGGRSPTLADLPNLAYTEMVVKEAMRLYPPTAGVSREPVEDVVVGGYTLPKGTMIIISAYAMHRNPRYFADPEAFIPERFSKENEANIPHYAYLPFGGGPRVCIGNQFALMEARLILATILSRWELRLEPGQTIAPEQLITIRPKHGLRMKPVARQPAHELIPG
jgi:cytochrome P450